jgi:hypothetical protein
MSNLDLECSVNVVQTNKLRIEYNIASLSKFVDAVSSAVVFIAKDVDSFGQIRVWGSNEIDSVAGSSKYGELESYAYVPFGQYVESIAQIAASNTLKILFSLAQAPIKTQTSYVTQDVYIRQDRPTLNFGLAQSIIVGNTLDGEYMTLLQFDISEFLSLNDIYLRSGDLVLTAYNWANTQIEIFEVNTNWTETNVTWNSFQSFNVGTEPLFIFSGTSSEIRVNILSYLNQMKLEEKNTVNLLLKVKSGSGTYSFFSKDGSVVSNHPRIEVKYQDMNWTGYVGGVDLESSAGIIARDTRDVSNWTIIRQLAHLALNGSAIIGRWEDEDVNSWAIPLHKNLIDSFAQISRCQDVDGSVSVPGIADKEIDSIIQVVESNDLDAISDVSPILNLESMARIAHYGQKDLEAYALPKVSYFQAIDSLADVIATLNLYSEVNISNLASKSLDSITQVLNSRVSDDFESFAQIFITNNLDSNAQVFKYKDLEIVASILQNENIESFVNILPTKNIESTSITRLRGYKDLINDVIFRRFDICEIDDQAFVMMGRYSKNLECSAIIKVIERDESLVGYVSIITNARQWIPGIHGKDVFKGTGKLPRVWRREDFIND